ncbi:MAG: LPS assembly lipoprotein LptE [Legionella sp.]|nr:LPS assembly lipoprotein LptE [Legionella sp.]
MFKRLAIFFMVICITGCGFKLRGLADMPAWLNNIAIIVQEAHRDLVPMLKDQLEGYGVRIIPDPAHADYLLIIENDNTQQQITSISASTTPRQYQIIYTVHFSLISKLTGKPIISSAHVLVTRQLTVNNDRILGSDSEGSTIHTEMRRDAVMQIINRISRKATLQ